VNGVVAGQCSSTALGAGARGRTAASVGERVFDHVRERRQIGQEPHIAVMRDGTVSA
jgi:hypothetical protein